MRDYWLSRLFYDLYRQPSLAAEYNADRDKVMARYLLAADVREALKRDDASYLGKRTNAYLLRFYFLAIKMKDEEFIRRLRHG